MDQPRVPAGSPEGGQWVSTSGQARVRLTTKYNDRDVDACTTYQQGHMFEHNNKLRTGQKLTTEEEARQEALDIAIGRGELAESTVVYRVVDGSVSKFYDGTEFVDNGFISTSKDRESAESIAFDWGMSNQLLVEIHIPKGTRAMDVNQFNHQMGIDLGMSYQNELLLGRQHRFQVVSKFKQSPELPDLDGDLETVRVRLIR